MLLLWSVCWTVVAVISLPIMKIVKRANVVETADDEYRRRHVFASQLLNGHYMMWPYHRYNRKMDVKENLAKPSFIQFIPENVVYTRMQMAGDRAFVVSPRYKPGVPFTLGFVPLTKCSLDEVVKTAKIPDGCDNNGFGPVHPYPSLETHRQFPNDFVHQPCDSMGLINVVDLQLGPDSILWVLDIGAIDTTTPDPKIYSEPRVFGIDVKTGNVMHKILLGALIDSDQKVSGCIHKRNLMSLRTIVVDYDDGSGGGCVEQFEDDEDCKLANNTLDEEDYRISLAKGCKDNDRADGILNKGWKPVAVYVGDAGVAKEGWGAVIVWWINDNKGARVTLPSSTSISKCQSQIFDNCDDKVDELDGGGEKSLHLALLDDFDRSGAPKWRRHLYFTYARHPDVFKISLAALRNSCGFDGEPLAPCPNLLKNSGSNRNRCVVNVGRKPHWGQGNRPFIPVSSAYGVHWYFRDPTAQGGPDLYSWETRRPFLEEYFIPLGGGTPDRRTLPEDEGCECENSYQDYSKDVKTPGQNNTDYRTADDYDPNNEDDDESYEEYDGQISSNDTNSTTENGKRGAKKYHRLRWQRLTASYCCMQITAADHMTIAESDSEEKKNQRHLWTLRTNLRDWIHGRTGKFGATSLLSSLKPNNELPTKWCSE